MTILWKHRRDYVCWLRENRHLLSKKGEKKAADHSHRGLLCVPYTNAKKKPRVSGTQGSGMRSEGYRPGVRTSRVL